MERRDTVPRWLGFSWWWLLAPAVLSIALAGHMLRSSYVLSSFIPLWALVQSTWLRIAHRSSRAVYWYVSAFVLFTVLKMFEHFEGTGALLGGSWMGTVLVLAAGCCYIAAACYFAGELREFVQPEDSQLSTNYIWPVLFGAYYFQYKLHEAYEDQVSRSPRPNGEV